VFDTQPAGSSFSACKKLSKNGLKDLSNPPVTHSEHEPDGERNTNEYHDNDRNWNTFSGGETSARGRLSK
jgi:hypothetical protein